MIIVLLTTMKRKEEDNKEKDNDNDTDNNHQQIDIQIWKKLRANAPCRRPQRQEGLCSFPVWCLDSLSLSLSLCRVEWGLRKLPFLFSASWREEYSSTPVKSVCLRCNMALKSLVSNLVSDGSGGQCWLSDRGLVCVKPRTFRAKDTTDDPRRAWISIEHITVLGLLSF